MEYNQTECIPEFVVILYCKLCFPPGEPNFEVSPSPRKSVRLTPKVENFHFNILTVTSYIYRRIARVSTMPYDHRMVRMVMNIK